jgi:hypothetical protein
MAFDPQGFLGGLGGILGGLFTDSGAPYNAAGKQYQTYGQMGQNTQQPFYNAGVGALGNYQDWLNGQKDPAKFINDLVGKYQESPYTTYLKQQSENAGINAASASGLTGSTPFMQQQQQNASNISQQGLDSWLQNVLGVNTQYGQGQNNLVNTGQNSANKLTDLFNNLGGKMGEVSYGKEAGKNQDFNNTLGGILSMIGSFL